MKVETTNNWAARFYTLWTGQALSLLGSFPEMDLLKVTAENFNL